MTKFRLKENTEETAKLAQIFNHYKEQYPQIEDCSSKNVEQIKDELNLFVATLRRDKEAYLANPPKDNPLPDSYLYGGICNDIPANLRRHKIDKYLRCIFVKDAATASEIEKALGEMELYIGKRGLAAAGNGAKNEDAPDDSRIVYIADMTIPGFVK
ncbi:MAG: hypothetical protein K2M69_07105 [Muribaculaceae bacterium]|nr:hypothetical protein [Muribaculaceae bacterium]